VTARSRVLFGQERFTAELAYPESRATLRGRWTDRVRRASGHTPSARNDPGRAYTSWTPLVCLLHFSALGDYDDTRPEQVCLRLAERDSPRQQTVPRDRHSNSYKEAAMASRAANAVIVVGAGIAGLSAAVAAREAAAEVTVIERATEADSGGNTRFTEAYLRMKSVDEVSDDFEEAMLGDFMGYHDPSLVEKIHRPYDNWPANVKALAFADPLLVSRLAEVAGPTLRWLTGFGITFSDIVTQFLTTSTSRIGPNGGGLALITSLSEAARKLGVRFEFETTACSLIANESGAVAGVRVRGPEGNATHEGSVILASGGFEGNPEMQARYYGEAALYARPVCSGGYYNKGEGIQMALDIGAAPCGNYGMFHAEPIDPRSGQPEPSIMVFPYGILVNKDGQRFTDEAPGPIDATYEEITRELHHQAEGIGYAILDSKIADVPNHRTAIRTDQPPYRAQTVERLAEQVGIVPTSLVATVQVYNAACPSGDFDPTRLDGLATEGIQPAKSNWARPIDGPPYEAYPVIAANVFSYGGLRVDTSARVVDNDGRPIRGLFAAGETVGMYFTHYAGSTSVLKGAVFGRLAGRTAAGLE
jgi:tricarballylate dehydrogenase